MCDIEKILKAFEEDLSSKTQKEKVEYLRSFGFQVSDKETEKTAKQTKQNKVAYANT